jgi:hypothetical protein
MQCHSVKLFSFIRLNYSVSFGTSAEGAVPGTDSTFSTELDRRGVPEGFLEKQVPGRIPGIHIQKNSMDSRPIKRSIRVGETQPDL